MRPFAALGDDAFRDASRRAFLAVVIEDICQHLFGCVVDDILGREARLPHPHVERPVLHEGKAALGAGRVAWGGHPEIQAPTPSTGPPASVSRSENVPATSRNRSPRASAQGAAKLEGQRVAVDADHHIRPRLKQSARIATRPEGSVDPDARDRRHRRQQGAQQDGDMRRPGRQFRVVDGGSSGRRESASKCSLPCPSSSSSAAKAAACSSARAGAEDVEFLAMAFEDRLFGEVDLVAQLLAEDEATGLVEQVTVSDMDL